MMLNVETQPDLGKQPVIAAEGLTVAYDARPVLRSVSFAVMPGEMIGVIGPNGAGKSTLLKCLLGLIQPDYGRVRLFGGPVRSERRRVAYVPQTESVDWDFPVTVFDVVMMGRARSGPLGWPGKADRQAATRALEQVGMSAFTKRHIRQLSGGQQRRVFLARALCQEAELLLLDEPFAGVDAASEQAIFALIDDIRALGKTVVVVNHDLSILERFDRVLMLNQRVIAYGKPGEMVNDDNLRATYGGRLSLLDQADETLRRRRMNRDPHLDRTTPD
ncbi:MAG: metal ABC transporter ATP-binding protein [Phycisphaerales bacterium JB063]